MQINQNVSNSNIAQSQLMQPAQSTNMAQNPKVMWYRPELERQFVAPNNNQLVTGLFGMVQQLIQVVVTLITQLTQMLGMGASSNPMMGGGMMGTSDKYLMNAEPAVANKAEEKKDGGFFGTIKNVFSGVKDFISNFSSTGIGSAISDIGSKIGGFFSSLF